MLFLTDFVKHPINTSEQIFHSVTTLIDLVRSDEWGVIAESLSPEVHQLVTQWDTLSPQQRGELIGYAIGKNGSDIFLPGALAKVATKSVKCAQELATVCKNLQIAQETLILETAANIGNGAKIGEVVEASQRTLQQVEELGLTTNEVRQLKQARKLEETIVNGSSRLANNPALRESYELFSKAQKFLDPYVKKFLPETQCRELIRQAGIPTFPKPAGIPESFRVQISEKGAGIVYYHPEHAHTSIRVMPGKPHSPFPYQQNPYVIYMKNGKAVDKFGNILSSKEIPEAHIPVNEFIYRD